MTEANLDDDALGEVAMGHDTIVNVEINDTKNKVNYKDYTIEEINNLTVKELQEIARKNKLKVRGKKDELIARVKTLYNLNIIMN